jgi:SAM-dependent methyltransferase
MKTAPDGLRRFSNRVDDYIRYRPGYPPAAIDYLQREHGLAAGQTAIDVGCGTGIFSELLLKRGCSVIGVEPNREMREAADRLLAAYADFRSIDGRAEATGLPDGRGDWVTAAQALHWFDVTAARVELRRVLKAELRDRPRVVLLWNARREDTPFLIEYERLLHEVGLDYARVKHQETAADGRIDAFFAAGGYTLRIFANEQRFDFDGLCGRTSSASYMPGRDHPRYPVVVAHLRELFDRHQQHGEVRFLYHTQVYVGRL